MANTYKKRRVYTENPFSYNFISLKKSRLDVMPTPSANAVITNPISHAVGKALGIDDPHEWNQYYDKVHLITEWAKERTGYTDPFQVIKWISNKSKTIPSLGAKKIDDLAIHIKLGIAKGKQVDVNGYEKNNH